MRIGHGYDVHRLIEGRKLIIGGIKIEHTLGLLGHSDADVLLHAIMDSILGALAKGDIGQHFSDQNDEFKDIDSKILLARVFNMMNQAGYKISNLDCTVIAQKPKLGPYIEDMRQCIADCLHCQLSQVNVKATTEEKLGFTGSEEGISAHAVVLLHQND